MALCTGFLFLPLGLPTGVAALGCGEQELQPNFSIEYREGPVAANRGAHSFLRILQTPAEPGSHSDPSGYRIIKGEEDSFISKETGEYKRVEDIFSSDPIGTARLEEMITALNEHCFWSLSASYHDPNILDGWYERIKVVNGETEKQVVCAHKDNKRFDKVKAALFRIFEETHPSTN